MERGVLDGESDEVHDQVREHDQVIAELRNELAETRTLRNELSAALCETREMVRLLKRDRTAIVARVLHELQGQLNDAVALDPQKTPRRRRRPKTLSAKRIRTRPLSQNSQESSSCHRMRSNHSGSGRSWSERGAGRNSGAATGATNPSCVLVDPIRPQTAG